MTVFVRGRMLFPASAPRADARLNGHCGQVQGLQPAGGRAGHSRGHSPLPGLLALGDRNYRFQPGQFRDKRVLGMVAWFAVLLQTT